MSLIKCLECGSDISDQALSCPHCGVPINQETSKRVDLNIDKYEITSKKWKKYLAYAIPLLVIGLPLFFYNLMVGMMMSATDQNMGNTGIWFFIGLVLSIVGGILFLIAKFGNWWERG